jgi:iron complex outermembrane receptor protein
MNGTLTKRAGTKLQRSLIPLVSIFAALSIQADTLPDFSSLSLEELSTIKVTSVSKKEQKLSNVAAAVYVISKEEIHRSGMTTVADLLRLVPGITVARLDSSKWAVTARGFNSRYADKLLVLIDGRSIYSAVFGGVYWDMSMPPLDDINRIEVIRGPGASVWGTNAVNGVINIITKTAGEVKGGSVNAGAGTAERAFGQVRFGGQAGGDITYRTYASAFDRSALQLADGQNAGDGWSGEQGGFRLDGTTRNGGWLLEADIYRERRAESGFFPSQEAGFAMAPVNGEFTGSSSDIAFEWRRKFTENSEVKISSSYSALNRPELGVSKIQTRTGDFEAQYHFTGWKHQDISLGLADTAYFLEGPATGIITMNPSQITYQVPSGFAQDEIHFSQDRISVILGVKIEHDYFSGWQPQPTARVLWAPNQRHSAWAAVSRATRTPTVFEEDITSEVYSASAAASPYGLPSVGLLTGSSTFQPEIMTSYEIGYRTQPSPRFSIDVATFYDSYKQLESGSIGTPSLFFSPQVYLLVPVPFSNDTKAGAIGAEVSFLYHPFSRWKLAGSYSHLDIRSSTVNSTPLGSIVYSAGASPHNAWKIQSYLNLSSAVQLDMLVFTSSAVVTPVYPVDALVPPHTRFDTRIGWRVSPRFEISVSGQDLLSPRQLELFPESITAARYVPRSFYLRTIWRF